MPLERITTSEDNIAALRGRYPDGLTFVVGDTHGEARTLESLMDKIRFDPSSDHVFFVGDYNDGASPAALLDYISLYYQADLSRSGFHLIRGNHERELAPQFPLENLPDIMVLRREQMDYWIVHAGMVGPAFRLICEDMAAEPEKEAFSYRLDSFCTGINAPLRQIIWSYDGLYSRRYGQKAWPEAEELAENHACIIHGHTPYCFFMGRSSYGSDRLFWENQHIWFSGDLCSFNIDSNVKGRTKNGEAYRGLACLCLEVLEETASYNRGLLSVESLIYSENCVFSAAYSPAFSYPPRPGEDIRRILDAAPEMKTISMDSRGNPVIIS